MREIQDTVRLYARTSYVDVAAYTRLLKRRSARSAALIAVLIFFALSLSIDWRRLLWYDEISTVLISGMPSVSAIWHAMHRPLDASTPTYFFLERIIYTALHHTAFAARFLSSVAACAGLLIVFDCVASLVGGLYGLIAIGVLTCSFLPYYAYEARAYSLFFLFSACALWIWLRVDPRKWTFPIVFGACFFAGELMHYYFILCLVPYFAYELLRWDRGDKRIRALIAAVIGVGLAGIILLPAALAVRQLSRGFWSPVSISTLSCFSRFFPYAAVPLVFSTLWLVLQSRRQKGVVRVSSMGPAEQLGWLFLLIPIAGMIIGRLVTHAFVERYFIGFLPGVGLAAACACSRWLKRFSPAAGVALILLAFGLSRQALLAAHPGLIDPAQFQQSLTKAMIEMEPKILQDGKKFIVVGESVMFLEGRYYSHHPEIYPYMPDLNRTPLERTNLRTLMNMSRLGWFQVWSVDQFLQHAQQTAVVHPMKGFAEMMHARGYKLIVKSVDPVPVYYLAKQ